MSIEGSRALPVDGTAWSSAHRDASPWQYASPLGAPMHPGDAEPRGFPSQATRRPGRRTLAAPVGSAPLADDGDCRTSSTSRRKCSPPSSGHGARPGSDGGPAPSCAQDRADAWRASAPTSSLPPCAEATHGPGSVLVSWPAGMPVCWCAATAARKCPVAGRKRRGPPHGAPCENPPIMPAYGPSG